MPSVQGKETSLKWLTVAMPLLEMRENRESLWRDKGETRKRLARDKRWSYGMADGLTCTIKIARERVREQEGARER